MVEFPSDPCGSCFSVGFPGNGSVSLVARCSRVRSPRQSSQAMVQFSCFMCDEESSGRKNELLGAAGGRWGRGGVLRQASRHRRRQGPCRPPANPPTFQLHALVGMVGATNGRGIRGTKASGWEDVGGVCPTPTIEFRMMLRSPPLGSNATATFFRMMLHPPPLWVQRRLQCGHIAPPATTRACRGRTPPPSCPSTACIPPRTLSGAIPRLKIGKGKFGFCLGGECERP